MRSRSIAMVAIGTICLSAVAVTTLLVRTDIHDPTEGGLSVKIVNDRQEDLFVAPCEDLLCRKSMGGGRLLTTGEFIAPVMQPFTKVSFAVKAKEASDPVCLQLTLDEKIGKSYGLSALTPCTP
jgi:hypothetical protein